VAVGVEQPVRPVDLATSPGIGGVAKTEAVFVAVFRVGKIQLYRNGMVRRPLRLTANRHLAEIVGAVENRLQLEEFRRFIRFALLVRKIPIQQIRAQNLLIAGGLAKEIAVSGIEHQMNRGAVLFPVDPQGPLGQGCIEEPLAEGQIHQLLFTVFIYLLIEDVAFVHREIGDCLKQRRIVPSCPGQGDGNLFDAHRRSFIDHIFGMPAIFYLRQDTFDHGIIVA